MKVKKGRVAALLVGIAVIVACSYAYGEEPKQAAPQAPARVADQPPAPKPKPIAPFVDKGIAWLAAAQHPTGGWGAGSHARQNVKDPSKVKTDPATTAFAAMALIRAGHTPQKGAYKDNVLRATEYLTAVVEEAPAGPRVTTMTGTQPQAKLGQLVDTSMTAQFLARVLPLLPEGRLKTRVDSVLDECLTKLRDSQQANGSWGKGGWAPVLQSASGVAAYEYARAAGKKVPDAVLDQARKYQKDNVDTKTGRAKADSAAGVELYAWAGAQRAAANETREARERLEAAKEKGILEPDAELNQDNLQKAGVKAPRARALVAAARQSKKQLERLDDKQLLAGFGNNGGEEFLSYMLTSESLFITGGEAWTKWNTRMHALLEKIQSSDGNWSGHHCISSPVFCTAAVIQCLTTDRDPALQARIPSDSGEGSEEAGSRKG